MELNLQQLLEQLQSCDESGRIEAKESKTMLEASAVETISAFSNEPDLGGGYLILGVTVHIPPPSAAACEKINA
jgi:ATP-dependent DNA helicase RecG